MELKPIYVCRYCVAQRNEVDRYAPVCPVCGETDGMEALPDIAAEGDSCMLVEDGGTGTYQTWYEFEAGQWIEQGSSRPWQLTYC